MCIRDSLKAGYRAGEADEGQVVCLLYGIRRHRFINDQAMVIQEARGLRAGDPHAPHRVACILQHRFCSHHILA